MKKIALLLAMLLLCAPVLCSCGANSSPEKAVATAIDVMYGEGNEDPEDFYAVVLDYNLDLLENLDSDTATTLKESIRSARKEIKETLNLLEDIDENMEEEKIDKWSFSYEIAYCNTYDKGGDTFDNYIEKFLYANTDIEDLVDEVAVVGVIMTFESVKDKETDTSIEVEEMVCYKIDGKWYVAQ